MAVADGREVARIIHDGPVTAVAFSPDGKSLATASSDKTARLWEVATGREIAVLRGHEDAVTSVAFGPALVTGSADKTARLWEVATGREIAVLRGHEDAVTSVAFGPALVTGSADKTARLGEEGPQRQVTIKPFAIGKHEVTFAEWDACVADGACYGYRPADQGWGRDERPVINVSWQDAQAYVSWLTERTGKPYRLPTEAEWEYAARAGTTTPFWFGMSSIPTQANYDSRKYYGPRRSQGPFRQQTVPVESLPANPWGLYEVHGNVWELVEDCWHQSYKDAPPDGSAWTEPSCTEWVIRGGSWNSNPKDIRSASRWPIPDARYKEHTDIGFRVARTLTP